MRTFDLTPFYRSTVGFDRLFDMLDNTVRPDWPPYDIEKIGDDQYRISMAVAGFSQDEIEITQEGISLVVTGRKDAPQDTGDDNWVNASDHAAFHRAQVPFLYFGVNYHPDYHRPSDDFGTITPSVFISATELSIAGFRALDQGLDRQGL